MSPRSNEGLKHSFSWFQQAAGSYRLVIDNILPELYDPPIGLDSNSLESLYYLNLAQAQESFWQKAVLNDSKDSLIARLAMQTSHLYAKCLDFANRSSSIRSEWICHITCKKHHFEAAAQYRAAIDCLAKNKYGEEVARLQASAQCCKQALSDTKYISNQVLEDLKGLSHKVQTDLQRAEKDNDLIYLQEVPYVSQLTPVGIGAVIAKDIVPSQMVDPVKYLTSIGLQPLFDSLVPFAVIQATKIYKEKIEEYIYKNVTSRIERLNQDMHIYLQQHNLPGSLEAVEKPLGVPAAILELSENVRSNGGVRRLYESFADNESLAAESDKLLMKIRDILQVEEDEDNFMRTKLGTDRWSRMPSSKANVELREELNNLSGYLSTAVTSDGIVKEKFDSVDGLLQSLDSGKSAIESYLPNSRVVHLSKHMEKAVSDLSEVLMRARGVERQREIHLSNLNTEVNNVDLYPKAEELMRNFRDKDPYKKLVVRDFEPILVNALNAYDRELQWVRLETKEQEKLQELVKSRNDTFLQIMESDISTIKRRDAIQSLQVAHFKFGEIRNNLDEGLKFYNNVLKQLQGLLDRCQAFVYERRLQGTALENESSRISNSSSADLDNRSSPNIIAPQAQSWTKKTGIDLDQ